MPSATYGTARHHQEYQARPDRPLVVKCHFDKWSKQIRFTSARNCSYDLLRSKVEQCFSLSASPYAIAYKDDDGEITDITTESDLTEAIQYFQAGVEDAPLSSAASILSGRSFGSKKIILRVQITVDYDGPSLSDTSSLISLEEYKDKQHNGSQLSFSLRGSLHAEPEEDAVTVSSRDAAGLNNRTHPPPKAMSSNWDEESDVTRSYDNPGPSNSNGFNIDHAHSEAAARYPEDPAAVFERLKLSEEEGEDATSYYERRLSRDERGVAWLREQTSRTMKTLLGAMPDTSVADDASISLSSEVPSADYLSGDLALEQDPRGRYYYSYTDGSSRAPSQGYYRDDVSSASLDISPRRPNIQGTNSEPIVVRGYGHIHPDTPPEVLQYLPSLMAPPPDVLTGCSACGALLEAIRYVCATCGEKEPSGSKGKGKYRVDDPFQDPEPEYPPAGHRKYASDSPSSSRTHVAGSAHPLHSQASNGSLARRPLPLAPSASTLFGLGGFELCSGCIESAGVTHAIETTVALGSSPHGSGSPSSPEEAQRALSQWARSAPRQKGQLRHGYLEKVWTPMGWEVVEHDDGRTCRCSTCNSVLLNKRYKCASCQKFDLCIACYRCPGARDTPSHAFLVVTNKPARSRSEPDMHPCFEQDGGEQSLVHSGVKCTHCMLDIVGARFHCAVCESVDICSNCESAGLPGNLDSANGGHNSSHIMIKIPYPLETTQVQDVSRRAVNLWTGRDAAALGGERPRSRANSLESGYARTVIGSGSTPSEVSSARAVIPCDACGHVINGVRYQCASCPSSPKAFSLCSACEARSYAVHDPMHIFIKIPRPVDRPLEVPHPILPRLYKAPVGPPNGHVSPGDPKQYLRSVLHNAALCDRCMTRIQGEWFRCAYCAKDLCDACEALDTHDDTHVFIVFKAAVDMQQFRHFADLENPNGSPPVISYPLYRV